MSQSPTPTDVHDSVRDAYAEVVTRQTSCCAPSDTAPDTEAISRAIGYSADELESIPDDANLGVGCGNPTALAALQPGQTVLDLGSGAGMDALLASQVVGPTGRVIGVDMTPEMLVAARKNAADLGVDGFVEFREGLIEALPVDSDSVDVVLSNCVINLSPDKQAVFNEAFRVLRPGGTLAISDILLSEALPPELEAMPELFVACISGAMLASDYLGAIRDAGFVDVTFSRSAGASLLMAGTPDPMVQTAINAIGEARVHEVAASVWSYKITGRKP